MNVVALRFAAGPELGHEVCASIGSESRKDVPGRKHARESRGEDGP